ncbi:hypothetical protein RHSIM_RhsimUnG0173600 [Rhododendron simsii]|uniref:Uncharacterized protein n=1 Tax=Rhododendron simsii TaxID=118357 RepID=A0A834FUQ4_RHOSS|nr:hypothetical protein RHSIM_RhsimUnG0173600 [Rhododendron simsii]
MREGSSLFVQGLWRYKGERVVRVFVDFAEGREIEAFRAVEVGASGYGGVGEEEARRERRSTAYYLDTPLHKLHSPPSNLATTILLFASESMALSAALRKATNIRTPRWFEFWSDAAVDRQQRNSNFSLESPKWYFDITRSEPSKWVEEYIGSPNQFSFEFDLVLKDGKSFSSGGYGVVGVGGGRGDCKPSFADIVAGKSLPSTSVSRFSIKVQDEGNQWLSSSAVAKLPALRSVESLSEAFIADGVWDIQIRSMGGNLVLLTFPSIEVMNAMLEESGLRWLGNWFDEVNRWKSEPLKEISRVF